VKEMYKCKIVADSIGPAKIRLVTFEITYPLFVHAEFLRHRILSRSGDEIALEDFSHSVASNRAIPTNRILSAVIADPVTPVWWGRNQAGMSAREELTGWRLRAAKKVWRLACLSGVIFAWLLGKIGLHKQLANRRMTPDQWVTQLVTGTDWDNFFALRCHPDAQPEIRIIAEMMRESLGLSKPEVLEVGGWHLPLVEIKDMHELWPQTVMVERDACLISASRCARFSLLSEKRLPVLEEIGKAEKLIIAGHMSPFEHQAQALENDQRIANLRGWRSFRSSILNEGDFGKLNADRAAGVTAHGH
jgi:hypothetical protein